MRSFEQVVASYQKAIECLSQKPSSPDREQLLIVLNAREEVHRALGEHLELDSQTLERIVQLDQLLKQQAPKINAELDTQLKEWRESVLPQNAGWWWTLSEVPKPNPIWGLISLILITLAIGLTAEVIRRSVGGGVDLLNIASQSLLVLLAGSAFTQSGQELVEKALTRFGINRRYHPQWKTIAAAVALAIATAQYLALPALAKIYTNNLGVRYQQTGNIDKAVESYERAISLDPDYAQAHYNLGTTYEKSLEFDKAIAEYQIALRNDPRFYYAFNNLARLYLLRGSESSSANALTTLNLALDQHPHEQFVLYTIYKNRAWAHLNLKLYALAHDDLKEAFKLKPDGAAAYCLRAQLLEAQKKSNAIDDWGACVANKTGQEDQLEAVWLSAAQERLQRGDTQ